MFSLQFFKLEVINRNGEVPSLSQLISHLEIILLESNEVGPPVGVLSTENRDNWYKAYAELIKGKSKEICRFF